MNCPQCGAPLEAGATSCRYCGEAVSVPQPQPQPQINFQQQAYQQPMYQQPPVYRGPVVYQQPVYTNPAAAAINPAWPLKNKLTAGLLGIILGGIGAHKFYLGSFGMGVVYLLFCWTGIPAIIGFIEGIMYLVSDDIAFQIKNRCRLQ